jgi:hypothetical protein
MKNVILAAGILALAAASHAQLSTQGIEVGFLVGGAAPLSGDSWLSTVDTDPIVTINDGEFKDHFKAGFAWGLYATGPISGLFGWRADLSRDSMPIKQKSREISDQFDDFDGNYHITRFQGGLQVAPFESDSRGRPYAFLTIGIAHESGSVDANTGNVTYNLDLGSTTAFGMSFGGGYNYLIGDNWGLGGDLHINMGSFEDSTRWWWTPAGQVFYRF